MWQWVCLHPREVSGAITVFVCVMILLFIGWALASKAG